MAIGSNTLGLLFKIGVDAKDAQQQVSGLKDVFAGMGDSLKKGLGEGAVQGLKDVEKGLKDTESSSKSLLVGLNQLREGFENITHGDFVEGFTEIGRSMGKLGPEMAVIVAALAAIAVAVFAAIEAFKGLQKAIEDVGTTSRDDFEQLQKDLAAVNYQLTLADHALAQGVLKAVKDVSSAVTALFVDVLRTSGPAIITFLNQVTGLLRQMGPLAGVVGTIIRENIILVGSLLKTLAQIKEHPALLLDPQSIGILLAANAEVLRKAGEQTGKELATQTGTFDEQAKKTVKTLKDLTDAGLDANRAQRELNAAREQQAVAEKEINADQAKGVITFEEGAKRRLAVLQEVLKAERAVLDAREAAVLADTKLPERKRQDELEKIAAERESLRLQEAARQEEENRKIIDQDQKLHDAFAAHFAKLKQQWIDYAEFLHKITDDIVKSIAQQGGAVPGGGGVGGIPGLPDPKTIQDQLDKIHRAFTDPFSKLADDWATKAGLMRDATTGLIDVMKTAQEEAAKLTGAFVDGLAKGIGSVVEQYVILGHTGPAVIKRILAETLASIAAQAAVQAIYATAYGFLMLATLQFSEAAAAFESAALFASIAVAAGLAGRAIAPSAAGAGAGAGTFGGSEAAPGTVTINQGTAASLGILASIDNHLSNLSTATPGDVVTRGAEQNPLAIGSANNEAARRDGTVSRQFLEIAGLRPA